MTIGNTTVDPNYYAGNDLATSFAYDFALTVDTQLQVILTDLTTLVDTPLVQDTDYTVDSVAESGGTITYPISGAPLDINSQLTLYRDVPQTQSVKLPSQGTYNAQVLEKVALDKLQLQIQDNRREINKSVKVSVTDQTDPAVLLEDLEQDALDAQNAAAAAATSAGDAAASAASVSAEFDTVALMVAATTLVIGQVVETNGDISLGDGGENTFLIVAASTGTDDGLTFIDLPGSGLQAQALFPRNERLLTQGGAVGDGVTDDTSPVNALKAQGSYVTPEVVGNYLTTLVFNTTGEYHKGMGRVETVDGVRANEVINMTTPPTFDQGSGIIDDFDGEFLSPVNTQISVTGATTVGTPTEGGGYLQFDQTAGRYARAFFNSGGNFLSYSNADRTGWAMDQKRLSHFGKGDAVVNSAFCFVAAKDPSIELCQGQPAAVLYNGQVTAGDDQVILNPVEYVLDDGGFDVVGKGLIINLKRNNHDEDESQFWCGYRVQSVGAEAAGAAFQAVGAFDVGYDTTGATVDKAIVLATGQEIHFDGVVGQHLPAVQWTTSEAVSIGDIRYNALRVYEAATAGTTGGSAPTHVSGTVSDGGVDWLFKDVNDFKSHARTFGGTRMLESGNVWQLFVKGTGVIQASAGSIALLKGTSVTGRVNTSTQFQVSDVKVLGGRIVGWSAATGTADRSTFVTSTVTTSELAERVKALIDDLRTHGMIGN